MKRLRSIRIGQVVGLGFGLILLMALIIGFFGRIAYDVSRWQRNTIETRSNVERLTLELEIISGQRTEALRRYLESNDLSLLAAYQQHQSAYADTYSRLDKLLRTPAETSALRNVELAEISLDDKAREVLALYNQGFPASARFLWNTEGIVAQDKLRQTIDRLRQVQGRTSASIISEARQTENLTIIAISIFAPLLLVGGTVASWLITRNITRPISNLVKTVTHLGTNLNIRVQPSGPHEIAFLGQTINTMAASLTQSNRSLQAYRDRIERELTLASQIQASFLPGNLPQIPNLELAVFWKSAREVGGDFYVYVDLKNGQHGLAVGDVSGKGTPAAMAGALSVGLLEAYAANHSHPEIMLSELNKDICARLAANHMNVACCYAIFNESLSQMQVANAGCMYPYLLRGGNLHEISARGLPLGAWLDFDYASLTLPLQPEDVIVFSSDGLVEAQNEQGDLLGFDRLQAELMSLSPGICAQAAVDHLVRVALDFTGSGDLADDITILAARIGSNSQNSAAGSP